MENESNSTEVWDPFNRHIAANSAELIAANVEVEKAITHYQQYPSAPRRNLTITLFIAALLIYLIINLAISENDLASGVKIAVWMLAIPGVYSSFIASTQTDFIGLSVAKNFNWLFKAGGDELPVTTVVCPQITISQKSGATVYNESWGFISSGSLTLPIWIGLFSGPIIFPDGSDKLQCVIVQLPRPAACDLAISPRMIDNALIKKSHLTTESSDFDKHFYVEGDVEINSNVFQVLTPPVLEAITELRAVAGIFRLIFFDSKAIFIFHKGFITPRYTSLFKSTTIDQRDLDSITSKLDKLTKLMGNVASQVN